MPSPPFQPLQAKFTRLLKPPRAFDPFRRFKRLTPLFVLSLILPAYALPVETQPPPAYVSQLAPLLTPVAEITAQKTTTAEPGDSGTSVLDERLMAVDAQGRRTVAYHFAYKTLTEAGIKSNSEDVYTFSHREQKAYVVLAETIQSDGTHQPVQPNAILVQSPQRQAEYSLYDDQSELKIIFPNVKPGSITHGIVVIEDLVAKLPGEVCYDFVWGSSWATERLRLHTDLPAEIAGRIKIETLGAGVPKPVKRTTDSGRVTLDWSANTIHGHRYETERPPGSQVGPAIHLSSVKSWDEIGRWYHGLLEGRGELKPELAKLVDTWVSGTTDRTEVITTLQSHVADDVRYVGLEFGQADYQPHDCNDVWANRYGDCKDKANLLVAMLHHRGVPASIALVNTDHLGLIDKRVPDYEVFSHAIVAIRQQNGYLFCDPTITYSIPGMIGTGSADRDVLVMNDHGAEWVHTPATTTGSLHYDFDLKLGVSGDLAGWLTLTSDGVYGARQRRRYTRLEPMEVRSQMSQTIRGFYSSAEVIDTERLESARDKPYTVKAYFTVPGVAHDDGNKQPLSFPSSSGLYVELGDSPERETTFFLDRDSIKVTATVAFPGDYHPEQNPADFRLDSSVASLKASWNFSPKLAHAELDLVMKRAAVSSTDFAGFYQGMQALQAWLTRPMLLTASSAPTNTTGKTEFEFPLMPTGDGQLTLVDQRYPEDGDSDMRRLALERTIQYFPKDKATIFRAEVRMAVLDWNADRNKEAHERLVPLLKAYAGQVTRETYAWGESVDGFVLRDLKRDDEALVILERISRDKELSADRRARAGIEAADIISKTSTPAAALDLLLEIDVIPDGATASVESAIARLLLQAGRIADLEDHLRNLTASRPDTCESELTSLLKLTTRWTKPEDGPRLQQLVKTIRATRPAAGDALVKACSDAENQAMLRIAHSRFTAALGSPPLLEWHKADEPKLSLEAYTKAISQADTAKDSPQAFRLSLQSLSHYGIDEDFPERLWRAAINADWVQRQGTLPIKPEVCNLLLDLCDLLPPGSDYFNEGLLLRASRYREDGAPQKEVVILRGMLESPGLSERYILHVTRLLAAAQETAGDYPAALALYRSIESLAPTYRTGTEALLRSIFIQLHLGDDAGALHSIEILQQVPASILNQVASKEQIVELLAVVKSGQASEVWKAGRSWWPQWKKFAGTQIAIIDTPTTVIPIIDSLTDLGAQLGEAKRNKDANVYCQSLGRLLSAARWLPSLGSEVGSLFSMTAAVLPGQADEFRQLAIAVLKTPHPPGIANLSSRKMQLAVHYIDGGRPTEALKVIAEFDQTNPPQDNIARAMRRLRGLAALATKQDLAPTAAVIEGDLADPKTSEQRATTIRILADLYRQLSRAEEEERLLKRELANPLISANAEDSKALQTRLTLLIGERDFSKELETWRHALSLPWYDAAEPRDLTDPRLRILDEVLASPDKHFLPAEQVKLDMLAAADPRRPLAQRQQSFRTAATLLIQLAPTYSRLNQIAASVADNPDFDDESRLRIVWLTLIHLCSENRPDDYRRWRKHALCERFNDTVKHNVALLDKVIAVDRTSSESIFKLVTDLSADEVSAFGGFVLSDLFDYVVTTGDIAAAEKFTALVPSWKLASDVQDTLQARQLDYVRRLRLAKTLDKVQEPLIALTTARYPNLASALPPAYGDLRVQPEMWTCSPADTLQACLFLIKTRQFNRSTFAFWQVLLRSIGNEPGVEKFIGDLFASSMSAAETDDLRKNLIGVFTLGTDGDNPLVREQLHRTLVREANPTLYPAAYLVTRLFEIKLSDRLGEFPNVETALDDISDPSARFYQQVVNMDVYARRRNLPALKKTVDGMKTAVLLSPGMITNALSAFAQLGLKEELGMAQDLARTEVRKNVTESWVSLQTSNVVRALSLAEQLQDSTLLPVAWVDDLARTLSDPFLRLVVTMTDATLRQDWPLVEKTGALIIRDYSTHYHYYWFHALAASKLGHTAAARESLKVYINYSKDEVEYPQAIELLQQLESK